MENNTEIVVIKNNDVLNNQTFYYRVYFYGDNVYVYNRLTGYLPIKNITSFIIERNIRRINGKLIKNNNIFQVINTIL